MKPGGITSRNSASGLLRSLLVLLAGGGRLPALGSPAGELLGRFLPRAAFPAVWAAEFLFGRSRWRVRRPQPRPFLTSLRGLAAFVLPGLTRLGNGGWWHRR